MAGQGLTWAGSESPVCLLGVGRQEESEPDPSLGGGIITLWYAAEHCLGKDHKPWRKRKLRASVVRVWGKDLLS